MARPDAGRRPAAVRAGRDARSPLRNPSPRVAQLAARVIVAADQKLGVDTDPRVRELAALPKAG